MEQTLYQQFISSPSLSTKTTTFLKEETTQPAAHNLYLHVQAYLIPHPQKIEKGGEDAYFISNDNLAIGVADGVGGWVSYGIDPALYSRQLMRETKRAYDEFNTKEPEAMLEFGYHHMQEIQGSTTACVAVLQGTTLKVSNLGDSGLLLIRGDKIFFRTKEQQHIFNFPVQLGTGHTTTPKDADSFTLEAEEGDIIILASDGLFDNLFDHEIASIVRQHLENQSHSNNLAQVLCEKAFAHAESSTIETPFTKHAFELGYLDGPFGGKIDDITVLVAVVSSQPTPTTSL